MTERKRQKLIIKYDREFRREEWRAEKLLWKLEKVRDRMSEIISIQTSLAKGDY